MGLPLTDHPTGQDRQSQGPLARWLTSDNEVLRSAAYRALPATGATPETCRAHALEALLDPDPDIRADAMEALLLWARPEDAETVLRSLEGDPVREVKLAAVRLLGALGQDLAVPRLRALVLSRCEPEVAWEDALGDWDDWLDVQIEAIRALGRMGAIDAIEDFFAARDDEFGQTLDAPVFEALSALGLDGVSWLLAVVKTESGPARTRAAEALAQADGDVLRDHLPALQAAPEAALRLLAVRQLAEGDPALRDMATADADPKVRAAALRRAAAQEAGLARAALSDPDPLVKVAALEMLRAPFEAAFLETLGDNLIAWLGGPSAALGIAAAEALARFAPARAAGALLPVIGDPGRPLDLRVAAVGLLETLEERPATETYIDLLANPASQIRSAALVRLRGRATEGDGLAADAIAGAIRGDLLDPEAARVTHAPERGAEVTAPKAEGAGRRPIRITPEGDIVELEEGDAPERAGGSTVAALQAEALSGADGEDDADIEADLAEDTPEESPARRKRRRAVEGPDEVAQALAQEALRIAGGLDAAAVQAALLAQLETPEDSMRRLAWTTAAAEGGALGAETQARGLSDSDAVVRHAALRVAIQSGALDEAAQDKALADPDALVRVAAVGTLAPEAALAHVSDAATVVRDAALARLSTGPADLQVRAVETVLAAERADTLGRLVGASDIARDAVLADLDAREVAPRRALILLDALSRVALNGATA